MTEQELLNKIKESADSVQIPKSLTPENMISQLNIPDKTKTKRHPFPIFSIQRTFSAAAVLLLCFILSVSAWKLHLDTSEDFETSANISTEIEDTTSPVLADKQDAGSLYTVAKSYDQIYEHLKNSVSTETTVTEYALDDVSSFMDFTQSAKGTSDYSTTNLQTPGVDESDRVKTDGRYIYTVTESKILITDTQTKQLSLAGTISPDLQPSDFILEFYVDNGKLILLIQHYDTVIEDSFHTKASTLLSTYDITNPQKPVLEGTITQDGTYNTSRKIGDIIYLFTNQALTDNTDSSNVTEEFLPCINGRTIPCNNIYLSDKGNTGLILSSVNISNPTEIVDNMMIIHDFVNIYVGNHSIYLYQTDYNNEYHSNNLLTEIAGFSMQEGIFNATAAASVKGEIPDTFAIHESSQGLQILTTVYDTDGNSSNQLYLLDKDLKLTGSLTDLAHGEEIYAARYLDNTAYFITYRNTDPLFVVDISNPSNPRLLGELEITGFSEYLHFWEKDKLLGIGYETDADSGDMKGLKLVMFDISDPVDLKVLDTLILENYVYSPALYNYKCMLADSSANLIGFAGEYQKNLDEDACDYLLYSWEDNHFTQKLTAPVSDYDTYDSLRGLYIDDTFFIVDFNEIISFDRTDSYKKTDEFMLK